jgi:hypothetical protein
MFIVPLVATLLLGVPPAADRPQVSVAPGTQVTLRHMKVGDRPFIRIEAGGVTFEAAKIRLNLGDNPADLDAVADGIRCEQREPGSIAVVLFSEMTLVGRKKKE